MPNNYYTPQVRFANSGSALTLRSVQSVEPLEQAVSSHGTSAGDFSGVVRTPYTTRRDRSTGRVGYITRDFRRFLTPQAVAPEGSPNNGGVGPDAPGKLSGSL